MTHGKECLTVEAAALVINERVSRFSCSNFKVSVIGEEGTHFCDPPTDGSLKINCDGSCHMDSKWAGFGCIARDSAGYVVGIAADF